MAKAPKTTEQTLQIERLKSGRIKLRIIGQTPLYFNAMSQKAIRDLLCPPGKKTAFDKRGSMKHDAVKEYRDSVYRTNDGPTLLCFPAPAIKGAMATAALETAGINKSTVNRLVFLPQMRIPIYGKPYLKMDVVRSADMNKTPDVRTRAYLPRWCSEIDIAYMTPQLSLHSIVSLMQNAGAVVGIGDFRQEKGRGSFGTFAVTGVDMGDMESEWDEITAEARDVQQAALDSPECADHETQELLDFLTSEIMRRAA